MSAINDVTDLAIVDGVAVITLDSPPVNALGPLIVDGLYDAFHRALADDDAVAILLICAGSTFIVGADVKVMGKSQPKVDFFELQADIENAAKPTVVALHGTPLGGGLEVALTFHYRIAVPSTRMGLPEVKLGLLPGGGGTQRLPRIVGARSALEMMTTGRQVDTTEALAIGLIDALAGERSLRDDALRFAHAILAEGRPLKRVRDLDAKLAADRLRPDLFDAFRAEHAAELRGLDAPAAIIRCVEAAVRLSFDDGLAVERAEFPPLVASAQSAALRHLFLAERLAAKVPGVERDTPRTTIGAIGIVGTDAAATELARQLGDAGIETHTAATPGDLVECDLVAIVGSAPAPPGERVVTLYPAPAERLLEIGGSGAAAPPLLAATVALAKRIGRVPVVCGDLRDGAISQRLVAALHGEAAALIGEGVPGATIDRVLDEFGFASCAPMPDGAEPAGAPALSDASILERLLGSMSEEGGRLLAGGTALRASDIDVVAVIGCGFPAWRGGPMFLAEQAGADQAGPERRMAAYPPPAVAAS